MNSIQRIKKKINGEEICIEVCDEGEFMTVNPKCYSKLSNRGKGRIYSVKELLLILLGIDSEIPLKKTLLMKEAFLFEKELSYELNLNLDSLMFVPYKYGSYSKLIDESLESMPDLVTITSSRKKEIRLTKKGKIEAKKILNTLPENKCNIIKMKRIGWDQWGNRGILKRVYTDYPIYTANSEIKDDILGD